LKYAFNECTFAVNDRESLDMTAHKSDPAYAAAVADGAERLRLIDIHLTEIKRRQVADLSTPCVAPILLVKAGIPRTATNNWNARREFQSEYALDADLHRDGHRLYSPRDCIFLMGVWEFASIGVPLPVAKKAARLAVDIILNYPTLTLTTRAGAAPLVLFRRDSEWCLSTNLDPFYFRGRPAKAMVYRDSSWRDDLIEGKDIPSLRVVFNVGEFGSRVMSKIGRRLLSAEDFRQPATKHSKPRRARKGKES
jgi:hypothetical protein